MTDMMSEATSEADRALKTKHRAMWAMGDYPTVASDLVSELGMALVAACRVGPGDRVLDVAAGSGNASIPAALAGAQVTAGDLTPELLRSGQERAAGHGAGVEWRQADVESLPFADAEFDTVMSCIGAMFAPHHQATADEMVRVCRPGGTVAMLNWTREGFIGQMFATMKPYAPPPPPGTQPAPLWGDEEHVREMFGDRVTDVTVRRAMLSVDRFATPEEFRDYFKTMYGPTIAAYRALADDPDKVAALDHDLAELARANGGDSANMEWGYLIFTARKRD